MATETIDLVLACFREPVRVTEARDRALPDDVAFVIRVAAGEAAALEAAVDSTGESGETLVEASVFFLQQILFAPTADSYRVLGATQDTAQERLRENYRWLMKWLHPDRNQDGWETVYADRVNIAWQDLKTPDRRANYDQRAPAQMYLPVVAHANAPTARLHSSGRVQSGPLLSGTTVRRLPAIILGALATCAAVVIGIMYWAQTQTEREWASRRDGDLRVVTTEPSSNVDSSADPAAALATAVDPVDQEQMLTPADAFLGAQAQAGALAAPISAVPAEMGNVLAGANAIDTAPPAESTEVAAALVAPVAMTTPSTATDAAAPSTIAEASAPTTASAAPLELAAPLVAPQVPVAMQAPVSSPKSTPAALPTSPEPADLRPKTPVVAQRDSGAVHAQNAAALAPPANPRRTEKALPVRAIAQVEPKTTRAAQADSAPVPPQAPAIEPVALAPAAASTAVAAVAPPAPPRVPPNPDDAQALLQEFTAAYAAGDLARFNRLFSGAGNPESLDRMRKRFGTTDMRFLELQQLRLEVGQESAHASARYRDTYVPRGARRAVTEAGVIEWVLRVDAGDVRIASFDRDTLQP